MQPIEHRFAAPGGELCWFEWGKAGDRPTLLLLHATGFHARCWDATIKALPQDWHYIALDLRAMAAAIDRIRCPIGLLQPKMWQHLPKRNCRNRYLQLGTAWVAMLRHELRFWLQTRYRGCCWSIR